LDKRINTTRQIALMRLIGVREVLSQNKCFLLGHCKQA